MSKTTLQKGRSYFVILPLNPSERQADSIKCVEILRKHLEIHITGWLNMANNHEIQFIESNGTKDEGTSPRAIKERRKRGTQRIPVKYIKAVDLGIDIIE